MGAGSAFARIVLDAVVAGARAALRSGSRSSSGSSSRTSSSRASSSRASSSRTSSSRTSSRSSSSRSGSHRSSAGGPSSREYAGDFTGTVHLEYRPDPDGDADPGEVVWAWVPYEEDHTQGKDRPVLVIGRTGGDLLALMLTSKDHDRDAAQEARAGRVWLDVGSGAWDAQRRPSEVRLDRVLRLDPSAVRREGATMSRATFDDVASALRDLNGW